MFLKRKWRKFQDFMSFWYFRYLLCTELYMVEPWERAIMNILFVILLPTLMYGSIMLITFLNTLIVYLITDDGR